MRQHSPWAGKAGTVEATVFQKTVDYPDDYAHGFPATLDDGLDYGEEGSMLKNSSGWRSLELGQIVQHGRMCDPLLTVIVRPRT